MLNSAWQEMLTSRCAERILATIGGYWYIFTRKSWGELPQSQGMERGKYQRHPVFLMKFILQYGQYSVDLIRKCRQNNVVTPFFRSVLYGEEDGYLGRPLTDSEVA